MEYKVNKVLEKNAKGFSEKLNIKFKDIETKELDKDSVKIDGFNFTANFVGGLSSLATVGAFSIYFSTLGNLGGYIFVSQTVSLLSALGISLGGTASVASALSVIGGPMTIVIGLAVLAGLTITSIFRNATWQSDLAKKIIKSFDQKLKPKSNEDQTFKGYTLKEVFLAQANKYWEDTINAVDPKIFDDELEKVEQTLREKVASNEEQEKIYNELEKLLFEVK